MFQQLWRCSRGLLHGLRQHGQHGLRLYGLLCLLALAAGQLSACKAGDAAGSTQDELAGRDTSPVLPPDPQAYLIRLPNGVRFLSRPVDTDVKRVVLGLYVTVGSLVEAEGERGLAHFVEHMAFNGTQHFPKHELLQFLDQAGIVPGADALARTDFRSTSYLLELPSDAATLERALLMLADWAGGISFEPVAVEQERSVVLAEKRTREDLQGRRGQRALQRWARGSRFVERLPIGVDPVLESATPEQLVSFYRRWYQPQNLIVVANGAFEPEAMRNLVLQHFGALQGQSSASPVPQFEVPLQAGDQVAIEADPELSSLGVEVGLKRPSLGLKNEWDYRRGLLDRLVATLLRRRVQELPSQPGSPLLGTATLLNWGEVGMYDSLRLYGTSAGPANQVLTLLLTEIERMAQHGFAESELARARVTLEQEWSAEWRSVVLRRQADAIASALARDDVSLGVRQERELRERLLSGIRLEDVNRHAALWARTPERQLLVEGRDPVQLPSEQSVRALAAGLKSVPVPPQPEPTLAPLLAVPPTPVAIAEERRLPGIDTLVWTLKNGARVVFKPMRQDRGSVGLLASSPGGSFRQNGSELASAQLAARFVAQLGLGENYAVVSQRLLSEAGVQLTPWIGDYAEGVRAQAYSTSLEALFQALYLTLSAPGKDPGAFDLQLRRWREVLRQRGNEPNDFFADEIDRSVWNNHPRYTFPTPESADQLALEPMRKFYLERLGDIGDFTFVFVGDTTEAELRPLVERYLATLPGSARADGATEADARFRPGITRVRVHRGTQDRARVSIKFHGDDPLPDSARADLDALGAYLEIRLREALRESMGGVYSVSVEQWLRDRPRQGYEIGFSFQCQPQQAEALTQAAFAVIQELAERGVNARYLEALRAQRARHAEGALKSPGFWRDELLAAFRQGRDPEGIVSQVKSDAHISSAALQRSARRYLRSEQYVDALLLPEVGRAEAEH